MCATFMTKTNLQTMKHVGKKMILGWTHQLKSTNCCSLCMSGRSCQNSNETIALPFPLLSTNNGLLRQVTAYLQEVTAYFQEVTVYLQEVTAFFQEVTTYFQQVTAMDLLLFK